MSEKQGTYSGEVYSLLYALIKKPVARAITAGFSLSGMAEASLNTRLMALGALIAEGRLHEVEQLLATTSFGGLSWDVRSELVYSLHHYFREISPDDSAAAPLIIESIRRFQHAVMPEEAAAIHSIPKSGGAEHRYPLLELDYARTTSRSVSGIVFFRDYFLGQGSRKHEFGYRIQQALASEGWDVSLRSTDELPGFSSDRQYDFAMIDLFVVEKWQHASLMRDLMAKLKRSFRKIIILVPDPWFEKQDILLRSLADDIDYIWGGTVDWSLTNAPLFAGKVILFPNVSGFDGLAGTTIPALDQGGSSFSFTGSIERFNLTRVFWHVESLARRLPIRFNITSPLLDDGLDRDASLRLYAEKLASTHASINFTTRGDGARILTGRSLEVISLNRLLLQELCPAFHAYFREGEHFVEFCSADELQTAVEQLSANPHVLAGIARQGYCFYRDRYASDRLLAHFQTLL